MKLRTFAVGPVSCNCSVVACPDTGAGVVIDPGGHPERILAAIRELGVHVKYLLHTHAHFDHILATGDIAAATGAEILLHRNDQALYEGLPNQGRMFGFRAAAPPAPTRYFTDGEAITVGTLTVRVLHTPGHTPGSVGFYFGPAQPLLFSGDTLFADSIGRTDFPGGSFEDIEVSIRTRLYTLPGDTRVIPGHGPDTTIEHEREHNPFVKAQPRSSAADRDGSAAHLWRDSDRRH
jgi:hydroxyacylglutathione hydrolase